MPLASSMAWSKSRARSTASTGPKISSLAIGASGSSTSTMVGPTNHPASGHVVAGEQHPTLRRGRLDVAPHPLVGVGVDHRADLHPGGGRVPERAAPALQPTSRATTAS